MKRQPVRGMCLATIVVFLAAGHSLGQLRPQTPQLLPKNTVALMTFPDVQKILPRVSETNLGQMFQDASLAPWAEEVYGWWGQLLEQVRGRTGVAADDLTLLFQGEVTVALVEQGDEPGLAILIDFAEDKSRTEELLKTIEKTLESQGARLGSSEVAGVSVRVLERQSARNERLLYVVLGNTFLGASHPELLERLLVSWLKREAQLRSQQGSPTELRVNGATPSTEKEGGTLRDSPAFVSVLSECQKLQKERPLAFWYVDPLNLLRVVGRDNPNIQFALVMIPVLGLDAVAGAGGAISAAIGPLDWFTQTHLLIGGTRQGALRVLSFSGGDYTPPKWVPEDTTNYLSVSLRLDDVLEGVRTVFDGFRGPGALRSELKRASDRIGVNIETELLPILSGRFVVATVVRWPASRDNRAQLFGLEVRDSSKAKDVLRRLVTQLGERITKESSGEFDFYRTVRRQRPRAGASSGAGGEEEIFFGLVSGWFVVSNQRWAYERAIGTVEGLGPSLGQTEEFRKLAARIDERIDPLSLALMTYENPRLNMRYLFELAQTDEGRKLLDARAQQDRGARIIRNLINRKGLPPFEAVEPYLVPQGSVLLSDQVGLHFLTFAFRELPEKSDRKDQGSR